MKKQRPYKNLFLVFLLTGLDLLCGPFLLYLLKAYGFTLYQADSASLYPLQFLLQTLLVSIYSVLLLIYFWGKLGSHFADAMGLKVRGGDQWIWVAGLILILLIMTGLGIRKTGDPLLVLLNLLYYLVFVGFAEEFLIRGVCVYLLKDFPWQVGYLLPNFLFAMLHVFAYTQFGALGLSDVVRFMTSEMAGLMAMGCCLQLLKNRTGTLWVPILIHGILDFMAILQ